MRNVSPENGLSRPPYLLHLEHQCFAAAVQLELAVAPGDKAPAGERRGPATDRQFHHPKSAPFAAAELVHKSHILLAQTRLACHWPAWTNGWGAKGEDGQESKERREQGRKLEELRTEERPCLQKNKV